jgi:hypothetical protein
MGVVRRLGAIGALSRQHEGCRSEAWSTPPPEERERGEGCRPLPDLAFRKRGISPEGGLGTKGNSEINNIHKHYHKAR